MAELVLKALIVHVTGGFFLALAILSYYWDREIESWTLEWFGESEWIQAARNDRVALFGRILAAGFPALIVYTIRNGWKLLRDHKLI